MYLVTWPVSGLLPLQQFRLCQCANATTTSRNARTHACTHYEAVETRVGGVLLSQLLPSRCAPRLLPPLQTGSKAASGPRASEWGGVGILST